MVEIQEKTLYAEVEEANRQNGYVPMELVERILAKLKEQEELSVIGTALLSIPPGSAMTLIVVGIPYVVIRQAEHDQRDPVAFTKDVLLNGVDAFNVETIDESEGEHGTSEDFKRLGG